MVTGSPRLQSCKYRQFLSALQTRWSIIVDTPAAAAFMRIEHHHHYYHHYNHHYVCWAVN